MFLNRADPPPGPARLDFRPYDLTVVRREQIKPEHFTISAAGVVHIQPGEPSQFIPLALWLALCLFGEQGLINWCRYGRKRTNKSYIENRAR